MSILKIALSIPTKIILLQILALLQAANALYRLINDVDQHTLTEEFAEGKTLGHCLYWGENVCESALAAMDGKESLPGVDMFDHSTIAEHAIALYEGVATQGVSRFAETLQMGGVEIRTLLSSIAEKCAWVDYAITGDFADYMEESAQEQVAYALGKKLAEFALENGDLPGEDWVEVALAELVLEFLPDCESGEVKAVIAPFLPLANLHAA